MNNSVLIANESKYQKKVVYRTQYFIRKYKTNGYITVIRPIIVPLSVFSSVFSLKDVSLNFGLTSFTSRI